MFGARELERSNADLFALLPTGQATPRLVFGLLWSRVQALAGAAFGVTIKHPTWVAVLAKIEHFEGRDFAGKGGAIKSSRSV